MAGRPPIPVAAGVVLVAALVVAALLSRPEAGLDTDPDPQTPRARVEGDTGRGPAALSPPSDPSGRGTAPAPTDPAAPHRRESGGAEPEAAERVTLWIRARPDGQPVVGARCWFEPTAESARESSPFEVVVSDADGHADAGAPREPGTWRAEAEGFVTARQAVEEGVRRTTVWLQPGRLVEGRVVRAGGRPIAGATVTWAGSPPDAARGTSIADPAGRFRVSVPNALVSLTAAARHCTPLTVSLPPNGPTTGLVLTLPEAIDLELSVRATDGGPMAHVAWDAFPTGQVQPRASHAAPERLAVQIRSAHADRPLGEATLRVNAPGYLPWSRPVAVPADSDARIDRVDAVLEPDPTLGRVRITVNALDPGRRVWSGLEPVTLTRSDGAVVPKAASVAAGDALLLLGLRPGSHRARVWVPGAAPLEVDFDVDAGATTEVHAASEAEARLRVRLTGVRGQRVLVRVLCGSAPAFPAVLEDPAGLARPEDLAVSGVPSRVFFVGETAVLLGGLPAGRHRIEPVGPSAADRSVGAVEVELAPGAVTDAELVPSAR